MAALYLSFFLPWGPKAVGLVMKKNIPIFQFLGPKYLVSGRDVLTSRSKFSRNWLEDW